MAVMSRRNESTPEMAPRITPEVELTPDEKARSPLLVATDLVKAGNFGRAASIFENEGDPLLAAHAALKAGRAATIKNNSEEAGKYYDNAVALYEMQIQKCIGDKTFKSAAMAAREMSGLFQERGMPDKADAAQARARDLLKEGGWKETRTAKGMEAYVRIGDVKATARDGVTSCA